MDALAAIAIREHGIAAAVGRRDDESGTYHILASGAPDFSDPSIPQPQPQPLPVIPQVSKVLGNIFLMITRNGRNDAAMQPTKTAKVIDPSTAVPKELKDSKDDKLLVTYLRHVW